MCLSYYYLIVDHSPDISTAFYFCIFVSPNGKDLFGLIDEFYSRDKVVACAKHFVGDGGTDRGINEGNTISSYEDLERIHIPPYIDCISQGVCTVMASYSKWNGSHLHSSHFLLTEVLKGKLGFKVRIACSLNALWFIWSPSFGPLVQHKNPLDCQMLFSFPYHA